MNTDLHTKSTKSDIYVERLEREWNEHGRIILAVDYDSTISYWKTIENQKDIEKVIELVNKAQEVGCYVVIHTACDPSRYDEITKYCKSVGIKVNSINENPIDVPYGGKQSKIFYNHQLCDRSGLCESMYILETAMYKRIGKLQYEKNITDLG